MSRPWLLLDRDDTILDDPGYLKDPEKISFLPGAVEGLRLFYSAGWPLVVVTNQSGIGRGYFGLAEVKAVHDRFEQLLLAEGVRLAGIYLCPHAPEANCLCRKPARGLADKASEVLGLELHDSVMVGDKPSDIALGRAIGSSYVAQIVTKAQNCPEADGHFESLKDLADHFLSS